MQNEYSGEEISWRLSGLTLLREASTARPVSIKGGVNHVRWSSEAVGIQTRAVDGWKPILFGTLFASQNSC